MARIRYVSPGVAAVIAVVAVAAGLTTGKAAFGGESESGAAASRVT